MVAPQWEPNVSLGDVLTLLGLALTLISLLFATRGIRQNTLAQRSRFLLDLTERYFADTDVRRFFYKVDYEEFKYDEDAFPGSDEERWLDSLLYTFDIIGYMVRVRTVTLDEVGVVAFQVKRVLGNPEVIRYLSWLDTEHGTGLAHPDARYLMQAIEVANGRSG